MKIGLVYTSTTPELIALVESEVKKEIKEAQILSYQDPSILMDIREAGHVTKKAGARLVELYMKAVKDEVSAILNVCSSVGEAADASRELGTYLGVPIIRIDEEMCMEAVRVAVSKNSRIGVLATLPTTLKPTKNTIHRVAGEMGKKVTIVDGLFDAFGADQETFQKLILEESGKMVPEVDVILLCQGSMAYCEEIVSKECGLPTFSSPRFGAKALKKTMIEKGYLTVDKN